MRNITMALLATTLFLNPNLQAQTQTEQDSIQIQFKPYTSLRGQLAVYDKKSEFQNNASRIGATASFKKNNITFLAATELQLNLFQGGGSFNLDASGPGNFLDVSTSSSVPTLSNRLGYLGLDFEKYGRLTFGKQWSVYYDITSYTDQFIVFGARASATYIGGTDGGETGTGRATQSIIYRNTLGIFSFGAQIQARGSNNDKFIDGYGFSGQLKVTNKFSFGAAINRALLSDELIKSNKVLGLKGQPSYYAAGFKYQSDKFIFNAVGVIEKNGDFTKGRYFTPNDMLVEPTIVFDSKGIEVYSKYNFNQFSVHAGYNLYTPNTKIIKDENGQAPLNSHFKVNDVILGLAYQPISFIKFYGEQRLSYGRNASNVKDFDVFTIGMIFNLSKNIERSIAMK